MAPSLNHALLRPPDSQKTTLSCSYIYTLRARKAADIDQIGVRLDLHGLTMNVTKHIKTRTHGRKNGMKHIATDADDIEGMIGMLKANGATNLEGAVVSGDCRGVFFELPDGMQLQFTEGVALPLSLSAPSKRGLR